MKTIDTFEFHKNNPGESVEKYVKRKRVELSHEINHSKKIYLDLKYWILFRDARMGGNVKANIIKLLHLIKDLVNQGYAICPISIDIFSEILKQSDPKTLKTTAQIVDDLSKGVSILSSLERIDLELFHFILTKMKEIDSVLSLDEMVWTKIAYVFGFVIPSLKEYPKDTNCALQKAFIDQMWVVSLSDMLDQMDNNILSKMMKFPDISQRLNEGKSAHIDDNNSFKQLFLSELSGILEFYKPEFHKLMVSLYESEIGRNVTSDEIILDDAGQWFANLIYHAFRLNKITFELPSFHVMAKLHAATRWDKNRIIKPNDIDDIHHAVDAIPYYDYFLTEHSLKHLVSCQNLGFEKIFHCKTISDIDDAINELSNISFLK